VALLREVDEHELEFPQGEVGERGLVVGHRGGLTL
jgi:hypothetical protein